MYSKLSAKLLFFTFAAIFAGCAAPENSKLFTPPENFDAGSYINPEDYGYNLNISDQKTSGLLPDSSFIPASVKGGYNHAVKEHLDIPKKVYRNRLKGKVILDAYIDSSSTLQYVKKMQSPAKPLTEATTEVLAKSEFNAATLDSEPVNSIIRVTLNFGMEIRTR